MIGVDEVLRHPGRPLVFAGARVITGTAAGSIVGDVRVEGDRVVAVGEDLAAHAGDALVIDSPQRILMPGLIDSHVHAWEAPLRGLAPDADFAGYLALTHFGLAEEFTPDDIAVAERLTAAQAINAGTTTIVDNAHNDRSRDHAAAAVEALRATGIRAVHAVGAPKVGPHGWDLPADLPRFRDEFATDRVAVRMFDARPTVASWRFADAHGLDLCAELGSWVHDVEELARSGLMRPGHAYNHCSELSEEVWRRISASGAAVNLCPRSDSQYGLGAFAPVTAAIRHGVSVGISSDNETAYAHDLFAEMRLLLSLQRGAAFAEAAGGEPSSLWGPADVLRAATTGGALNAGIADSVGTIEPGRKADLVLVASDDLTTSLVPDPVAAVVSFAGPGTVDTVLVDGVIRKWAGSLVGSDVGALVSEAESSRDRMLARVRATVDDVRAGALRSRLAAARGPGPFLR